VNSVISGFFQPRACQRVAERTTLESNWCGSIASGQDFNLSSKLAAADDMQRFRATQWW
jgi:hypothetical protein